MSIFSKLIKKADGLRAELEKIQQEFIHEESRSKLEQFLVKVNDIQLDFAQNLVTGADSFLNKKDYEDPVTGAKRFGAAMQSKIIKLGEDVSAMETEIQALQINLKDKWSKAPEWDMDTEDKPKEKIDKTAYFKDDTESLKKKNFMVETIKQKKEAQEMEELASAKDQQEQEQLRLQAQTSRDHKAEELKQLKDIIGALNSREKCTVQEGRTIIDIATTPVENNVFSFTGGSAATAKTALQTVQDILDRIIKKPDEIALRKIRISHPVLRKKLAPLPVGGVLLLLAVGFQANITACAPANNPSVPPQDPLPLPTSVPTSSEPVPGGIKTDGGWYSITDLSSALFSLISPHTAYEVLLDMVEPPLDLDMIGSAGSGVKSAWLTWFDSLTVAKDFLEAKLTEM